MTTPTRTSYASAPIGGTPPVKTADAASNTWVKKISDVVNNILKGKLNAVTTITLNESETTTTVIDARIGPFSALLLQPLTAHAAGALYSATSVLVTAQQAGQATLTHASLADTDLNFNLVIIG